MALCVDDWLSASEWMLKGKVGIVSLNCLSSKKCFLFRILITEIIPSYNFFCQCFLAKKITESWNCNGINFFIIFILAVKCKTLILSFSLNFLLVYHITCYDIYPATGELVMDTAVSHFLSTHYPLLELQFCHYLIKDN